MTPSRRVRLPCVEAAVAAAALLLALAPVAIAAGPEIVAGQPGSVPSAVCADPTAVLVNTSDGVFRCERGVPVPREQPWNWGHPCDTVWVEGTSRADDGLPGTRDTCTFRVLQAIPWPHAVEAGR